MSKITAEEKQSISNGVKLGIAAVTFLITMSTLVWKGAFYVFDYQATKNVVLALEAEIKDLRRESSEKDAYHESLIQALNIKYERKQDK